MHTSLLLVIGVFVAPLVAYAKEGQGSEIHDLFVQYYPGGAPSFQEAIRERADWSPLQLFEYQSTDAWGEKWDRFNAMGPVVQCPEKVLESFGAGDGEKRLCGTIRNDDCLVISVGSHNEWDFEEALLAKYPHCRVHTLDCFADNAKVPATIQKQVTFHPICLGVRNEIVDKRVFMTWLTFADKIGLSKPPSALKMDIEGFEWALIPAIIKTGKFVPESFSFELHYSTHPMFTTILWTPRLRTDPEIGLFMELLYNFGYVLVDRHDNPLCLHCTEIVISKLVPSTRFAQHTTNALQSNFATHNQTHQHLLNVDPYPTPKKLKKTKAHGGNGPMGKPHGKGKRKGKGIFFGF